MKDLRNIVLVAGSVLIVACGGPGETPEGQLPEGHPDVSTAPLPDGASQPGSSLVGTVMETLHAGGYTFARIEMNEREVWVAGPQSPLEVGQSVALDGAMLMRDFTSTSLDRTFEEIYFLGSFEGPGAPPIGGNATSDRGAALEVLSGGGYTYVHVQVDSDSLWIAGPETPVSEGQIVSWAGATEMGEFRSNTLDRTFPKILFVAQLTAEGG